MKSKNGWATAGLVLGILSIFFAPIGIIPVSGLAINIVALAKSRKMNGNGKWFAIVGLILSILYFIVYLNRYGYIHWF